jgi:hypothetical protein
MSSSPSFSKNHAWSSPEPQTSPSLQSALNPAQFDTCPRLLDPRDLLSLSPLFPVPKRTPDWRDSSLESATTAGELQRFRWGKTSPTFPSCTIPFILILRISWTSFPCLARSRSTRASSTRSHHPRSKLRWAIADGLSSAATSCFATEPYSTCRISWWASRVPEPPASPSSWSQHRTLAAADLTETLIGEFPLPFHLHHQI